MSQLLIQDKQEVMRCGVDDPDILAFAQHMSSALPDIPLQGLDIIKEVSTNRPFALESNPGGNSWRFSSRHPRQAELHVDGAQ